MPDNRLHILRDIADGEIFRHEGHVILRGNVGKDANIDIANGGIKIIGDVGDGATIRTRGDGGIKIKGKTGSGVRLDSDKSITLDDAGPHLRIHGGSSVTFGRIAEGFNLHALAEVNGGNVGQNAHLRTGGSCVMAQAGDGTIIEAAGLVQITFAGHDCRISSGDRVNAAAVGAETAVTAEKDALIGCAHRSATIKGKPARIREFTP